MVVQGVRIRKMVQLVTLVLLRRCTRIEARWARNRPIEVHRVWRWGAVFIVGATFFGQPSSLAAAQSDGRRPMRQVETDDGVIMLTNSPDRAPGQTITEVVPSASRELALAPQRPPPGVSRVEPQPGLSIVSWLFPLVLLALVTTATFWIWRSHSSRREATRIRPGESSSHSESDDTEPLEDEFLESAVDELPAPSGQWVEALRDSVPPSAPGRSSVRSVAQQWVSQPVRKPGGS